MFALKLLARYTHDLHFTLENKMKCRCTNLTAQYNSNDILIYGTVSKEQ